MLAQRWANVGVQPLGQRWANWQIHVGPTLVSRRWPNVRVDVGPTLGQRRNASWVHISSVLWPLCISCFNTGDVLHKEWCLTTDYHLHQDDPYQVSSLTKTSHIIHRFPYAIWGPSLISFFLSPGMGSGSSKQASKQEPRILKFQYPEEA